MIGPATAWWPEGFFFLLLCWYQSRCEESGCSFFPEDLSFKKAYEWIRSIKGSSLPENQKREKIAIIEKAFGLKQNCQCERSYSSSGFKINSYAISVNSIIQGF